MFRKRKGKGVDSIYAKDNTSNPKWQKKILKILYKNENGGLYGGRQRVWWGGEMKNLNRP